MPFECDSNFEMLGPGKTGTFVRLKTLERPTTCWFNILYHQPLRLVSLLELALDSLEAFQTLPNCGYVSTMLKAVLETRDPLYIQVQLIACYVTMPPLRQLFRAHCCEVVWTLALGHLASKNRDLLYNGSRLHMSRDELATYAEICLQPLALRLIRHLVVTWDPGHAIFAFRDESADVGVDEEVVQDATLRQLESFRQIEGHDSFLAMKTEATTLWNEMANRLNEDHKNISSSHEEISKVLVSEIMATEMDALPHTLKAVVLTSLARPNRAGKLYPLDAHRPWTPGDPLKTLSESAIKHFYHMARLAGFAPRA